MTLLRCVPYLRIWSYLPVKYQGSMRNKISLLLTSQMPEPEERINSIRVMNKTEKLMSKYLTIVKYS